MPLINRLASEIARSTFLTFRCYMIFRAISHFLSTIDANVVHFSNGHTGKCHLNLVTHGPMINIKRKNAAT